MLPSPRLQPASKIRRPTPTPPNRESLPQINQREADQSDDQENPAVFLHHLIADRIWISGQANFIFQAHEPFHSPTPGPTASRAGWK
jgi:hypothetical protein